MPAPPRPRIPQDGNDLLLLRCSYAGMEAREPELLARHDFEALITYLKVGGKEAGRRGRDYQPKLNQAKSN